MYVYMCHLLFSIVNRRMDEWVELERVNMVQGTIDEGTKDSSLLDSFNGRERKVTRKLKRRHDEINHVQKVRELIHVHIHVLYIGMSTFMYTCTMYHFASN